MNEVHGLIRKWPHNRLGVVPELASSCADALSGDKHTPTMGKTSMAIALALGCCLPNISLAQTASYYSANDGGVQQGNFASDGATGNGSIAAGIGALASGVESTALGAMSVADGDFASSIGYVNTASGENSSAVGNFNFASGDRSNAFGRGNSVFGADANAFGSDNFVDADGALAIGNGNAIAAGAAGSLVLGNGSSAAAADAVAIGNGATAGTANSVALGAGSATAAANSIANAIINGATYNFAGAAPVGVVSVGSAGAERQITNVAAGRLDAASTDAINGSQLFATHQAIADGASHYYSVNDGGVQQGNFANDGATGANAIAAGVGAVASGVESTALGAMNVADGDFASALGYVNTASGEDSSAVGSFNFAGGDRSNAFGSGNSVFGADANAFGSDNFVDADGALAIGNRNAIAAGAAGSIVLGNGSSAAAVDAVAIGNGATSGTVNSVALGAGSATAAANSIPNTIINGATYNFAGVAPVGVVSVGNAGAERQITNVAAGRLDATSTDAINGSQLFATNQAIEAVATSVDAGMVHYYSVNDGGTAQGNFANNGATASGAIASGVDASASANNAVAIGAGASATTAGSVALGAGSVTATAMGTPGTTIAGAGYSFAGVAPVGTVSVGDSGAERTVTNVAAGRVNASSTDAVNGSQLHATNQAVETVDGRVANIEGSIGSLSTTVGNFDNRIMGVEKDVAGIQSGADGLFQVSQESSVVKPKATGTNSAAGGNGAKASGSDALAIGNQSTASAADSTAIGTGATTKHANSVALGAGSVTTRGAQAGYDAAYVGSSASTGEVNVGGRTIAGVAPGVAGTDAANVNQLNSGVKSAVDQSKAYTDSRFQQFDDDVWSMRRDYRGATASAMAMAGLPQAYSPGKSMLAMGMGGYQGEYGMAVGLSGITEDGRWVYKAQASGNTTSEWGFSVGAGIQW